MASCTAVQHDCLAPMRRTVLAVQRRHWSPWTCSMYTLAYLVYMHSLLVVVVRCWRLDRGCVQHLATVLYAALAGALQSRFRECCAAAACCFSQLDACNKCRLDPHPLAACHVLTQLLAAPPASSRLLLAGLELGGHHLQDAYRVSFRGLQSHSSLKGKPQGSARRYESCMSVEVDESRGHTGSPPRRR